MPSKKFFPRNAKAGFTRGQTRVRSNSRIEVEGHSSKCRNLRDEFDKLARSKRTLISDDEINQLWKQMSIKLLTEPASYMEEYLDELYHTGTQAPLPIGS